MPNAEAQNRKVSAAAEAIAGASAGSVTVVNARSGLAPRSREASTIVQSSFSTDVCMDSIMMGNSAYVMPSTTAPRQAASWAR